MDSITEYCGVYYLTVLVYTKQLFTEVEVVSGGYLLSREIPPLTTSTLLNSCLLFPYCKVIINNFISSEIPWTACHVKDPGCKSQSSTSAQVSRLEYTLTVQSN